MKAYTYILRCGDGSLYTGWTTDPERRLKEHNGEGKGARYTRARRPCTLAHLECFEAEDALQAKRMAMRREWEIKHRLSREQKEALCISRSLPADISRDA